MNCAQEAVPNRDRLPQLTFINYSHNERDRNSELILINTHCSKGSLPQRHTDHPEKRATIFIRPPRNPWVHAASTSYDTTSDECSLLVTLDRDSNELVEEGGKLETRPRPPELCKRRSRSKYAAPQRSIQAESPPMDSFGPLPIESKGVAPNAFEFFAHVYAPLFINSSSQPVIAGFQTCVQVLLQDAMLFEQMMAYCLAMQSMDQDVFTRMTAPILRYSNRSVMRLRERLESDQDNNNEVVIMTIITLAATYLTCGEYETVGIHVKALRRIIALQGGHRKLGWGGFLELKAKQIDKAYIAVQSKSRQRKLVLVYPKHPFEPALCEMISRLPIGFGELALHRRLSIQFIHALDEAMTVLNQGKDVEPTAAIAHCIDGVANASELTPLERLLAYTLLAHCFFCGDLSHASSLGLQANMRSLPLDREVYVVGQLEEDALDWAALMLCATTEEGSDAWNWAERISQSTGLDTLTLIPERRQKVLERAFFKIPTSREVDDAW